MSSASGKTTVRHIRPSATHRSRVVCSALESTRSEPQIGGDLTAIAAALALSNFLCNVVAVVQNLGCVRKTKDADQLKITVCGWVSSTITREFKFDVAGQNPRKNQTADSGDTTLFRDVTDNPVQNAAVK